MVYAGSVRCGNPTHGLPHRSQQRAHLEFNFIDVAFVPYGKADMNEHEGGEPDTTNTTDDLPRPSVNTVPTYISPFPLTLRPSQSVSLTHTGGGGGGYPLHHQTDRHLSEHIPHSRTPISATGKLTIKLPARSELDTPEPVPIGSAKHR